MLKEDKKLGLSRDLEEEEEIPAAPVESKDQAGEVMRDVDLEDSDTEAVQAALAEFAINEEAEQTATEEVPPANTANTPDASPENPESTGHQEASSDEGGDDEQKNTAGSMEPQMSKRDKRRAREAKKKLEAEAAAGNQTEVSH